MDLISAHDLTSEKAWLLWSLPTNRTIAGGVPDCGRMNF
jgi:hypothetical protein